MILKIPERWKAAQVDKYGADTHDGTAYYLLNTPTRGQKYEALQKLDLQTCSAEDVNKIIGNGSWTRLLCNECNKPADWVIEVGEAPDYESSTARLCRSCAAMAASLAL